MKSMDPYPPCDCHRPAPPCPSRKPVPSFLMQRILASGKIHRRCQCYSLHPDAFPCQGTPPYTLINAAVCGQLSWQEMPCHEKGAILLQVSIPLSLQIRDETGNIFTAYAAVEEQIRLHCTGTNAECWRGQIYLQAAARLCSCIQFCQEGPLDARLEIILEGFLLTACPISGPGKPPCPPPRPWYPEAHCDPWMKR